MSEELVVLVDEAGNPIGTAEKYSTHHANTPLHLAFSCYIFNDKGELLVTQRAHAKKVWPGVWTNSVCGHPLPDESTTDAIARRTQYELGMTTADVQVVLPDYRYTTPPFNGIIENEICPVYVARASSEVQANPTEVEAYRWMNWHDYCAALENDTSDVYSWWAKDQLKQLKDTALIREYSLTN